MSDRPFTERDIHMALDGELPAEEREEFDTWLANNPEMKARSDRLVDDMERLRGSVATVPDEPIPDRLTALVKASPPNAAGNWLTRRTVAAAAAIFVVGGIAGYFAGAGLPFADEAENQLAELAIGAYVTFPADLPRAVEVGGDDRGYLDGWLSRRTGLKIVAPDLSGQGFELLGGRILPGIEAPAALLIYKDQAGNQLSIYMTPQPGEKIRGTYGDEGGPSAIYWMDRGFGCAIVSRLPNDRMTVVARNAWRQLLSTLDA